MMDGKAIQEIKDMADKASAVKEVDGKKFSHLKMSPVLPPICEPVMVMSLDSLIDFSKIAIKTKENWMYQVHSPTMVEIICKSVDSYHQREVLASSDISDMVCSFGFGDQYTLDKFMVAVQNNFMLTEQRQNLIDAVSRVSISDEDSIDDDGFTQTVTAKAGVTLKSKLALPNPVQLKAFKTFPEIEDQMPEDDFIFRVEKGHKTAYFKLFEPESMTWQLKCVAKIKEYLKNSNTLDVI